MGLGVRYRVNQAIKSVSYLILIPGIYPRQISVCVLPNMRGLRRRSEHTARDPPP